MDKREIKEATDNIEKSIVDLYQDCISEGDLERAYMLAQSLKSLKPLKICLYLARELGAMQLIDKISGLVDAQKMLDGINAASSEASKAGGNEIVIMKNSQNDAFLQAKAKQAKKGLSAHAIQLVSF